MSPVTHMNESCHTYEWVMSHIWMSPVTHMNESCHTYEWVTSRAIPSHCTLHSRVPPQNKRHSHSTYDWVMSRLNESCHMWMSHDVSRSCQMSMRHVTYEWVTPRVNEVWNTHGLVVAANTIESSMSATKQTPKYTIHSCVPSQNNRHRHGTYERVMSHMNESCRLRMSHVTYDWVTVASAI